MNGPFRISERAHSGFILMTRLADVHGSDAYVTLKDVADSMRLSEAYLEEVAASLKAAGLVRGRTGPKGGYALARDPATITAEEVLTAIEGPVTLVECQSGMVCPVEHACASKTLWGTLQKKIVASLKETTLAEMV